MKCRSRFVLGLLGLCWISAAISHAQQGPAPAPRPSLGGLLASRGARAGGEPALAEIAALIAALERDRDSEVARPALVRARTALQRSRAAAAAGRSRELARVKQLAWAALALATRQIALAAAERAHALAEQRAKAAEASCRQARDRLAQSERARAAAEAQR